MTPLGGVLLRVKQADTLKHAARVAVACLEFLADEIEAGRITPESAVRAVRVCVRYCKEYLPPATIQAWPALMQDFRAVVWQELLKEAGTKTEEGSVQ